MLQSRQRFRSRAFFLLVFLLSVTSSLHAQWGCGEFWNTDPGVYETCASQQGGTVTVPILAPAWSATLYDYFNGTPSPPPPWWTIISNSGSAGGNFVISLTANTTHRSRDVRFLVSGNDEFDELDVIQAGIPCTLSISPTSGTFSVSGGTGNVTVTTPTDCEWEVEGTGNFGAIYNIISPSSLDATGPGAVTFQVLPNSGSASRTNTFTVVYAGPDAYESDPPYSRILFGDSVTYTITQSGLQSSYNLSASSNQPLTGLVITQSMSPTSVGVVVKDSNGDPASNVAVSFAITQDPDTVAIGPAQLATLNPSSGTNILTNSTGVASTQFTAGAKPGVYIVTASCASNVTCTPATVPVAVLVGCSVMPAVTSLSQGGPNGFTDPPMPWGNKQYDHLTTKEIYQRGCGLTALTMAVNFAAGASVIDPGSFSDLLYNVSGAYLPATPGKPGSGGGMNWPVDVAALRTNLRYNELPVFDSDSDSADAETAVENQLCDVHPHPVVIGVRSNSNPLKYPGHYVLVTGVSVIDPSGTKQYAINDPAGKASVMPGGGFYTNSQGNPEFQTRGTVTDPEDLSSLSVSVDAATNLTVTDSGGNQTGFSATTGSLVQNIPNSATFIDEFDDDAAPGDAGEPSEFVIVNSPGSGNYTISLTGSSATGASPSPYVVALSVVGQDGSIQSQIQVPGISAPGSSSTIKLSLLPTPGSSSVVAPQITFTSTLADISNSLSLGLITNSKEATLLSQSIQVAEKATGRGQVLAIKGFIVLVDALALTNQITGVAPAVLLQDAKSLLGLDAPSSRVSTLTGKFNSAPIQGGGSLWLNSAVNVVGLLPGIPTSISVTWAAVSFASGGTTYNLPVPNGTIEFSPTATSATTVFNTSNGEWQTTIPFSGIEAGGFLSGLAFAVPAAGLPANVRNVTWTGTFSSDTPGVVVNWQWGAAVYSQFSTNYSTLGIQPVNSAGKSAGSPLNFQSFLLGGGTGNGGSNYTGSPAAQGILTF